MSARRGPPADGHPLAAALMLRQHEVQVVAGPGDCLAAAWTDDSRIDGVRGWTCGYAVSADGGQSWSEPHFHKNAAFAVSGNPSIAVDARGVVHAVAMSVQDDYTGGVLEWARSADGGRTWSDWVTIVCRREGIPDRPRLLMTRSGILHLVFSDVGRGRRRLAVLRSTILICSSRDLGLTWSEPRAISLGLHRSRWFVDGYQGPAIIETPNGSLLCSWAEYYGNAVGVSTDCGAGLAFGPPVRVSLKALPGTGLLSWMLGATFGTPVTELAVDPTGRHVVGSVHEAHAMGPVLLLGSADGAGTWRRLGTLARSGTNACLGFDRTGRLHAIWTELRGRRVDVRYATSTDFGRRFSDAVSIAGNGAEIVLPRSTQERQAFVAALGSYQSLVIGPEGRLSAFWIDLRQGLLLPRLYQSTWQV